MCLFLQLKAFNLIRASGGQSQSAVFEYSDSSSTETSLLGLSKIDIAGFKLSVQRVPAATAAVLLQPTAVPTPAPPTATTATAASILTPTTAPVVTKPAPTTQDNNDPLNSQGPTRILRLSNMTTSADLADDELFLELKEDVLEECGSYGTVVSAVIPRGVANGGSPSDELAVGQIFVEFATDEGAVKTRNAVNGRTFNGQTVCAHFYPVGLFHSKVSPCRCRCCCLCLCCSSRSCCCCLCLCCRVVIVVVVVVVVCIIVAVLLQRLVIPAGYFEKLVVDDEVD